MAANTFTQRIKVQLDGANKAAKGADKVAGGMKKLAKSASIAAAAFFGTRKIIDGLKQSIELSTRAEALSRPFEKLNQAMGGSSSSLQTYSRALDGTINEIEIMRMANQAMTLGVADSENAMAELFDIAQRLGKSLGVDTRQAVDSLVTGMGRQSILMLDNLGIIIDSNQAYETYATSLGITTSQLTDQQKKLAFNNAALESAREKVEALGAEQLTTSDKIAQLGTSLDTLKINIGTAIAPVINNMAKFFNHAANSVSDFFRSFTETDLQRVIRELRAVGGETIDFEIELQEQLVKEAKENANTSTTVEILQKQRTKLQKNLQDYIKLMDIKRRADEKNLKNESDELIITEELKKESEDFYAQKLQQNNADKINIDLINEQIIALANLENQQKKLIILQETKSKKTLEENGILQEFNKIFENNINFTGISNTVQEQQVKTIKEANPVLNKMKDAFAFATLETEKFNISTINSAMAIGVAQKDSASAAKAAATAHVAAAVQKAIASFIASSFSKFGIFGGVLAAGAGGVVGKAFERNLKPAAEGMNEVVTEPTLILAGEEGAEYVNIEPTQNEGAGMGGATVVFQGNVLSNDFIENEAVPMIKEALRKGGDLGIS